jgi:L-2-hydroxyglutarate oxidase
LINCAGLQSDRIAQKCGVNPGLQIVPFRGEYYEIIPEKQYLVKNLIYPVPDPRFPFLGVHFTRRVTGGIEAGPNAVLAFKREGYRMSSISPADMLAYGTYSGFYRMAFKFWKTGIGEMYRSLSKAAFVKALQVLLPDLISEDLRRGGAGVRAQALEPDGKLTDDFRIVEAPGMVHVLNAPSPAATASLSIGKTIAAMAADRFALQSS